MLYIPQSIFFLSDNIEDFFLADFCLAVLFYQIFCQLLFFRQRWPNSVAEWSTSVLQLLDRIIIICLM